MHSILFLEKKKKKYIYIYVIIIIFFFTIKEFENYLNWKLFSINQKKKKNKKRIWKKNIYITIYVFLERKKLV